MFPGVHLRRKRHEGDTANKNKKYSHEFFLSGLVDVMGLLSAGAFVNANFTVDSRSCSALTKRNLGKKCSPSGERGPYKLRSMKTNLLFRLKNNERANEIPAAANSNITILFLLFVAQALA